MMGMTWKETIAELTKDFMSWGCPFSRKKLPEIAMGYDCTPLFFWNWMDDPETPRSEKGFLRVLGYAWRKYLEEELSVSDWRAEGEVKAGNASLVTGAREPEAQLNGERQRGSQEAEPASRPVKLAAASVKPAGRAA